MLKLEKAVTRAIGPLRQRTEVQILRHILAPFLAAVWVDRTFISVTTCGRGWVRKRPIPTTLVPDTNFREVVTLNHILTVPIRMGLSVSKDHVRTIDRRTDQSSSLTIGTMLIAPMIGADPGEGSTVVAGVLIRVLVVTVITREIHIITRNADFPVLFSSMGSRVFFSDFFPFIVT